jgi:hypothetical protein
MGARTQNRTEISCLQDRCTSHCAIQALAHLDSNQEQTVNSRPLCHLTMGQKKLRKVVQHTSYYVFVVPQKSYRCVALITKNPAHTASARERTKATCVVMVNIYRFTLSAHMAVPPMEVHQVHVPFL